ncbi:hypothetical protein BV898_00960 [Hypsibius exemplaris]|uniref:Uncharacterized protein n=1 Tax=Hypsibius exemplaris TaxID=2072580 RepID=A0A1W0XCQ5_HYPEX|nr:hypothetical protein BV898_00960 [Hypsibius exemplaris]
MAAPQAMAPAGTDPNSGVPGNDGTFALPQSDGTGFQSGQLIPNQGSTGSADSNDQLQTIRNNMIGGVEAIRDSIVGLIAFLIGGAKQMVATQVQGVVDTVHRVENKTAVIRDNLASAGGALVHTWGDSIRQTGNITSQLVRNVGQK